METTNGAKGREVPRQIAPRVAGKDVRAGIALVIVALVFLLCPGCGEGAADAAPAIPKAAEGVVVYVEGANGWDVLRSLIFGAVIVVGIKAARRYYTEKLRRGAEDDAVLETVVSGEAQTFDEMSERVARETERRIEAERSIDDANRAVGTYRVRAERAEADLRHMRARVPADQAALDACARLLDGKRGEAEFAKARETLRATGRLLPRAEATPEDRS